MKDEQTEENLTRGSPIAIKCKRRK